MSEDKIGSIEDFDKNQNYDEKPFVSDFHYRIIVEQIPKESYTRHWIEVADRFDCDGKTIKKQNLKWKRTKCKSSIKEAKMDIDDVIIREKVEKGYYIKEIIDYP